jgi:hypothetical protein
MALKASASHFNFFNILKFDYFIDSVVSLKSCAKGTPSELLTFILLSTLNKSTFYRKALRRKTRAKKVKSFGIFLVSCE